MSELIRKVLEAQAAQQNGASAAAPKTTSANAPKSSANPATPAKAEAAPADAGGESAEADESLVEETEVQDTPEVDDPDLEEHDDTESDEESGESKQESRKRKTKERIDELLKERKQARSKLEKAEQRIQELEEQVKQSGSKVPAPKGDFTSMEEVDKRRLQIRDQLRTVNRYIREGGYTDNESGDTIQVEELERIAAELEDERDLTLPEVADRLRERERIDRDKVAKLYPDLLDEDSETYLEAEELFEAMPFLRTHPEGRLWVGRMLKGKRLERVPVKATAKPTTKTTKTPAPPREPGADGAAVRTSVQPPETTNRQQELVSRLTERMLARTNR